jgi:adenosylhomocysteine nucleosidase
MHESDGRPQKNERVSLVCFALNEEAAPFRKMAAGRIGVHILITGVGRKNAEHSLGEFLRTHSPGLVLTCGFAGGLTEELAPGAIVFETSDPTLRRGLAARGAKPARFFCAERIATTIAEKRELRQGTGADAVEMESEAIQAVCHERGIPCATVRAISDAAGETLPLDFNRLMTPELQMDYRKLAGALLKSPGKIGALLKLQKQCKTAAEALARVLAGIIPE